MLSFEQKIAIADSFPELQRKPISLGRVNYHYEGSAYDKKTVVYHLHPNGNGFVYAADLAQYDADDKGFVNVREFTAEQFRSIIAQSIRSLTASPSAVPAAAESEIGERWINAKKQSLTLQYEEDDRMWYVFAGLNLEATFDTYEEAKEYLAEEGFSRS